MQRLYAMLVILFTALVVIFIFQNAETVTVRFLTASISLPRSVMLIVVYLLGMLTGGFVMSMIRKWMRGARTGSKSGKTATSADNH
ncbi:MAG: lipopolysaccharide assembly protein LapA domain-containing protein [Pseudomonadota bacterium]